MNIAANRAEGDRNKPPITEADYLRIHCVVRSVLDGVGAHTSESCLFFSLVGAYLLEEVHRLSARPVAGAAFYSLGGTPNPYVIAFARFEDDCIVSDDDAFHGWVECEGWAIDFMAPIFQENSDNRHAGITIPRRMFQRSLSSMGTSCDELFNAGDFFLLSNPPLTRKVIAAQLNRASVRDLANICAAWYRPSPQPIAETFAIGSDDGVRHIALQRAVIDGAW